MSLNPLYQRLRELDPYTFEDLCFQLLTAQHPSAGIARVDGAGGDGGVDLFRGELINGPAVWQCKFFVNGIKSPQKKQIKKSLKAVVGNFQPKLWILCVPVNLDTNAHAWFQELKRDNKDRLQVALFQASEIVHQLLYYRPIRDAFFPGAILDGAVLRSQLSGTSQYSNSELDALTFANLDEYLQRLRDRDGRFEYQITFFPRDTEQVVFPPKLLASIAQGDKRIDVFARDEEALRRDPPRIIFGTVGEATRQLQHAIETGTRAEVSVSNVRSAFDFIAPLPAEPQRLLVEPHPPPSEPVYLNVSFGAGTSAVTYEGLEFRRKRLGTREAELETTNPTLPFSLSMILRFGGELSARFSVEERFIEKDVRAVQKFVNAMTQLKLTGLLDVDETQHGKKLFSAVTDVKGLSELKERFKDVIDDLCEIAERFGLQLRMASAIDNETLESIPMLLELARTGRYQVDLSNVSVTLAKVTDEEKFMAGLSSENSVKFDLQQFTAPGRILGKEVELGPCSIVCPRAVIKNSDDARRRYLAAKDGEGIVLEFGVLSPAQILLATV